MRPASVLALVLAAPACGPAKPPSAPVSAPPGPRLTFLDAGLPEGPDEAAEVRVSPGWTLGERSGSLRLQVLARAGERIGDRVFGEVVDVAGNPLTGPQGESPWMSDALDFVALYDVAGTPTLLSHLESRPAALYRTTLEVTQAGTLTPTSTRPVDLTAVRGAWNLCAGDATPWETHLAAEEYEPLAACIDTKGAWSRCEKDRYADEFEDTARALPAGSGPRWAYDHGWMIEVELLPAGERVRRRPVLGRFSHELGLVLPDERTVVLSDDMPTGGGLYLFVADAPRDLSAGSLYAARYTDGALAWVPLGHASEADLAQAFTDRALTLEDLVVETDPPVGGACPDGTRRVANTSDPRLGPEVCARVVAPLLASRFETRRAAAHAGATVEWTKGEGLAVDAAGRRVFAAFSVHGGPMADDRGDLRLPPNRCGALWVLDGMAESPTDASGQPIPSAWVPTRAAPALAGRPEGSLCAVDGVANPDNLTWLDDHGLLVVAEDTRAHAAPTLWAWDPSAGEAGLVRLATAPPCGEWAGLHSFPDRFGHAWITVSLQHAFADTDGDTLKCGTREDLEAHPLGARTWAGVLGPLPRVR